MWQKEFHKFPRVIRQHDLSTGTVVFPEEYPAANKKPKNSKVLIKFVLKLP